jgi:hypothetical protein
MNSLMSRVNLSGADSCFNTAIIPGVVVDGIPGEWYSLEIDARQLHRTRETARGEESRAQVRLVSFVKDPDGSIPSDIRKPLPVPV